MSGRVLPALQTGAGVLVAELRQAVALAGPAQREAPVPRPAAVAAPARHLRPARALASHLVAQLRQGAARVARTR